MSCLSCAWSAVVDCLRQGVAPAQKLNMVLGVATGGDLGDGEENVVVGSSFYNKEVSCQGGVIFIPVFFFLDV